MAVKIAIESFLAVVQRSNLIPPEQLQPLVEEFQKQRPNRSQDARKLADFLVARKTLTAWQAEKLLQGKHKGFLLGKYRLLSLVGKGGMSSVYLAEHMVMKRRCAIKVLPTRRLENASYLARFHREAQAVASLDHPNIVRAYDVDHANDNGMDIHFLVMEFVDGKGLLELVLSSPQTRLPPVVAAEYIRQAALGLQHAHAAGLVHRDVKPGNVLVDRNGTVKILDLGLARIFEGAEETSLTVQHDERVLGTADYLAPEQAVDSHNVDARADIYSLGCTLYLCLTGQPPFTQGTLAQRLLAHQTKEPPSVESLQPEVPPELGEIVRRMMAKDPARRYQTSADVAEALTDWLKTVHRTDRDRSYAGLDRKTPLPPERRSSTTASAKADTIQGGSRADSARTPLIEPRQAQPASPVSSKPQANAGATSSAKRTKSRTTGLRNDQETVVGSPPQPPAADDSPVVPSDESLWDGGAFASPPAGQDSLAIDLPVDDEPIRRRPAKKQSAWLVRFQELLNDRRYQPRIIGGAVGMCVVVVLVVALWAAREPATPGPTPPPPTPPSPPEDPTASLGPKLTVGDDADFQTINDALSHIRKYRQRFSGDSSWTVTVAGGRTYDEAIVLRNSGMSGDAFPEGVQIVSAGERPAILQPAGSGPVIDLDGISRLTLQGFVLDGNGRDVVARLAGYPVGTLLQDLEFRDVSGVGIAWDEVTALSNDPVRLINLRFHGRSSQALAVRMGDVRQVQFDRCQFLGPFDAAIEFASDVWNADVSIRHSLFFDLRSGIRFSGEGQDLQRISISNNTFCRVQNGIVWDHMPLAGSSGLKLHHNLFSGVTDAEAIVRAGFDAAQARELRPAGSALNNWTDRPAASVAGESTELDLFEQGRREVQDLEFESTAPGTPGFLRPITPSVTIELKSAAQEADPIVGAITP